MKAAHVLAAVFAAAMLLATPQARAQYALTEPMKNCRVWRVPISNAATQAIMRPANPGTMYFPPTSVVTLVDGVSMNLLYADGTFMGSNTRARVALDLEQHSKMQLEARSNLAGHLTSGNNAATCAATGTESTLVSDQIRQYLEAELQRTVKASVEAQMAQFLTTLKEASQADRDAVIQRALEELPKNPSLVQALKNAIAAPKPPGA